ncbi:unnamed protein product, partial [Mesorhabditis spiculigera]
MGFPIWLWHPKTHSYKSPVEAHNYRCCCSCCTSKCGFTFILIFWTIAALLNLAFLLLVLLTPEVYLTLFKSPQFYASVFSIICVVCGLCALKTKKPSWMQLFLICWTVLSIITWALWVLEWTLGVETANARVAERRAKENKPQINTRAASWILLVPVIILALIIQIILTFLYISFYRFLRDRQLEKEQHEGTMMSVQANRY